MRDPARIEPMLDMLRKAWERNPDWRLGQLVVNAVAGQCCGVSVATVFNVEDDVTARGLKMYAEALDVADAEALEGEA